MDVDQGRLRADIEANAEFGALPDHPGRGRTLLCGTAANGAARDRFVRRLEDAGLDVSIDAVGNIAGRWTPESADPTAPPVVTGSHLDSVPTGGIFDGPLGVYGGLEAVRTLQDAGIELDRPIQVVSFTEEEGGRFGQGVLGSSVATGVRTIDAAQSLTDDEGESLRAALESIGYAGNGRLDVGKWGAWLELHIEQSGRLETAGVPVGIVSEIAGITQSRVVIDGETDHAGATPMNDRTDALAAAAEVVLAVEEHAISANEELSGTTVGTTGRIEVEPNVTNVVPGRVELGIDIRAVSSDTIDAVTNRVKDSLNRIETERGVETAFTPEISVPPTPMDDRLRELLHDAGEAAEITTMNLHSGAAHDSMHVATVTEAGMLFAPSRDGISHSPGEWTEWDDCAAATRVLAGALASLAGGR